MGKDELSQLLESSLIDYIPQDILPPKILGVNENFQPKSRIYIYNRFGQLLLYVDPSDQGWDGTFNGGQLPQDDYWFKVFFEDGREHSGHFSLLRDL